MIAEGVDKIQRRLTRRSKSNGTLRRYRSPVSLQGGVVDRHCITCAEKIAIEPLGRSQVLDRNRDMIERPDTRTPELCRGPFDTDPSGPRILVRVSRRIRFSTVQVLHKSWILLKIVAQAGIVRLDSEIAVARTARVRLDAVDAC